ncbi:MAG TPA: hypothetical protein VEI97_15595 [bacterium]|nr:hypothetical protein [bacterium]
MPPAPKPALIEALRNALGDYIEKERPMFGCRVFWVNGLMCGFVDGDRVALRLPADQMAGLVEAGWAEYWAGGEVGTGPSNYVLFTPEESRARNWMPYVQTAVRHCLALPKPSPRTSPKKPPVKRTPHP